MNKIIENTLIIVPAYNEEKGIGKLLKELKEYLPLLDVIVINDGSTDETAAIARNAGVKVLNLACNLGVGGAVQTAFQYAFEKGYHWIIRIDGDGQHPPVEILKLVSAMKEDKADLIIGSRFAGKQSYNSSTLIRLAGVRILALFLSIICRRWITDPTSGFWMINRKLLRYFAHSYPTEYPEPEAIALLRRHGFDFYEEPVRFRPRETGRSSIGAWGTIYYIIKVGLALVIDRIKPVELQFIKENIRNI